jgi:hypothetical protein
MTRLALAATLLLAACAGTGGQDWPALLPISDLTGAAEPEADIGDLLLREAALRARARLLSGEVLTAEERRRLEAAAARWQGA